MFLDICQRFGHLLNVKSFINTYSETTETTISFLKLQYLTIYLFGKQCVKKRITKYFYFIIKI